MSKLTERGRKGQGEPLPSTSQDFFKSLRRTSLARIILGKRAYSEFNITEGESERPSTLELSSGALRLGNKILRTSPLIRGKPSTSIEQSGDGNPIKGGQPARNDKRDDKGIHHNLREKDYKDHRLSSNHDGHYTLLHHDDRSRFSKPSAFSISGQYTISKDYTGGEEVRRSHLLEIYGKKCGAKRGSLVFAKQQDEETRTTELPISRMDPIEVKASISPETNETRQQGRVVVSQRGASSVWKKNSRIHILRNLKNIDHLMSQSNDEREIEELEQQMRLLRDREEALDSRQRKKQQTERLEDEKKQFTALISDMEEELSELSRRNEQLRLEKEEMIRSHTIETSELKKKISILTEHIERLQNPLS